MGQLHAARLQAAIAGCEVQFDLHHSCPSPSATHPAPQDLTARDRAQATNLITALGEACPEWAAELQAMLASGSKAEIEALDTVGVGGLRDVLLRCVEDGDCI